MEKVPKIMKNTKDCQMEKVLKIMKNTKDCQMEKVPKIMKNTKDCQMEKVPKIMLKEKELPTIRRRERIIDVGRVTNLTMANKRSAQVAAVQIRAGVEMMNHFVTA